MPSEMFAAFAVPTTTNHSKTRNRPTPSSAQAPSGTTAFFRNGGYRLSSVSRPVVCE